MREELKKMMSEAGTVEALKELKRMRCVQFFVKLEILGNDKNGAFYYVFTIFCGKNIPSYAILCKDGYIGKKYDKH